MSSDIFLIRKAILLQADAAFPASLPIKTICIGLELSGLKVSEKIVEREIEYLQQKSFLSITFSEICPTSKRVKITATGIDFIQSGEF